MKSNPPERQAVCPFRLVLPCEKDSPVSRASFDGCSCVLGPAINIKIIWLTDSEQKHIMLRHPSWDSGLLLEVSCTSPESDTWGTKGPLGPFWLSSSACPTLHPLGSKGLKQFHFPGSSIHRKMLRSSTQFCSSSQQLLSLAVNPWY